MPRGFQIPGQAYDPYTGEPLNPDEQEAYARLQQTQQNGFTFPAPEPPSTGNPELDARLGGMAAGFGNRNIPQVSASESLGNLGRVAGVGAELATSSYADALGLPDNWLTQELTRPVNYIPIGRGVTAARAVTESIGGRLAVEAAKPLVEQLPESWQGAADLGINIAGQVATGGLYGRSGGALGMSVKEVGDEAVDPLLQAKRDVLEGVRKESNIRKVGTAAREVTESRGVQTAGIRASAEMAQPGEDLLSAARKGAYLGGEGSGRQMYAAALDIPEEAKGLLFDDLRSQMLRGDLREFDYLRSMKAVSKVIEGEGLQPNEIGLVRRVLGDEVADVVSRRPQWLEPQALTPAKIAEERARLDALGRKAAQDSLKSAQRESVKEVEQRLRQLGADTDLPIPPRPSDETLRLAAMTPERVAGDLKNRVVRAQKIVGAYKDGIANAAKRDRMALEKSNKIIEEGIDFEAKQTIREANTAAAKYAQLLKRQEAIHGRRLADEASLIEEGLSAETAGIRQSVSEQASTTMRQMSTAAQAARNKARDEMIDAFNRADSAEIQSVRSQFESLAARENARSARFRTPGVLEGAQSTVKQADDLLARLTQKFPDEATLFQRADELTEKAAKALPRAEREAAKAKVREMVRIWEEGNRVILDSMGDEAPAFVRSVSSMITGNVADSWLTAAMQRKAILSTVLRSELDPKVANRVADALFNKEMIAHYKVADPSKLPAAVKEMIAETKNLPYEEGVGAVETLVQRAKNTQFGLADLGVFGVNGLNAIRRGGIPALAGGINKSLAALHLPHVDVHLDSPILDRNIRAALDGVHQGTAIGSVTPDKGSLLQYGGKYAQKLDNQIDKLVQKSNDFQFGTILGSLRNADYEGNLVMLKLLGRDIDNPLVRAQAAANANHLTGYATGALNRKRATAEGIGLTSTSMTRARVAQIADLAKLVDPRGIRVKGYGLKGGPTAEQRIMAAMGIVSTVGYTLAVGKLLNDRIGVTDFIFDPSIPGFGTITTADGRTHDLVPQDSVERAFAKSVRAIVTAEEADIENALKGWGNVLVGSSSVVARAPMAGFGVGYQPGIGYRYGDWGEGMTGGEKAASLLPIPPIATDLATQGFSPVGTTETFTGIANYPAGGKTLVDAGLYGVVGTPQQQLTALRPQAWMRIGNASDVPEDVRAEVGQYKSHGEWAKASTDILKQRYIDLYKEAGMQLEPGAAQVLAENALDDNPTQKWYSAVQNMYEREWARANPALAIQVLNEDAKYGQRDRRRRLSLDLPTLQAIIEEAQQK